MADAVGEPGQELNLAAPTGRGRAAEEAPVRQAATVILLRDSPGGIEVLLVKRNEQARFMGGVWVFPGGAVDVVDGPDPHRATAVRELAEEASIRLTDPARLVEFSRWITPAQVKVRFDTRFFLAELPSGQTPRVDGHECVAQGWFTPQGALDAHACGEIVLVFPTIKHLEQLAPFATVAELLDHARGVVIRPVQPRVRVEGEVARVLLPGEPGYEQV